MTEIPHQTPDLLITKTRIKGFISAAIYILPPAIILFGTAGTLNWPMAWVFIGICTLMFIVLITRCDPDLREERSKKHDDAKRWDKVCVAILFLMGSLVLAVAGLDMRFGWTGLVPPYIQIAGMCLVAFGYIFSTWAVLSNKFFSTIVRIQNDRGHRAVSTGPYRFVRHPGYAGMLIYVLFEPLMFGSFWALIPAVIMIPLFVVRTALEDRTLQEELAGYDDYAKQVRYRLVPGIW
jgi:protein-S-isoprenylcysteine O-methyltransferase Ste14